MNITTQSGFETDPRLWIGALRHSQDRLASAVRPLTPDQLRGPSYHSWSIAEVLAHLGSQAEIYDSWVTAALTHGDAPGVEFMQPIWDAWNNRDPDAQAAESLALNERLVARFEGLSDGQLQSMYLNLFGMELHGDGLPRLRTAEHALHTWDILVALDPAARVSPDAVALLVDTLGSLASLVGKPTGKRAVLHVHTTEPERDYSLRLGDVVELTGWDGGPADGQLVIPAEAFLRLVYGRFDRDHAPDISVTGPVTLDELRAVFPGV